MSHTRTMVLAAALAAIAGQAQAEYVFTFGGTVVSGDNNGTDLAGENFTIRLFVSELASDLTPSSSTANYAIDRLRVDIDNDGSDDLSLTSGFSAFNAVYIDPGSTQLVGAMDLFGPAASFILGVHVPTGSFADPKDLGPQSNFSLSGLISSSFNYMNTDDFNAVLDTTSFSFQNTAVIPLPTPVAMAGLGLVVAGAVARRRAFRDR